MYVSLICNTCNAVRNMYVWILHIQNRQKICPQLSDILGSISNLSKDWISNARPCSPRVLFYFESSPVIFQNSEGGANIKKLEHLLEDQIYHVLRKNRIITNIR